MKEIDQSGQYPVMGLLRPQLNVLLRELLYAVRNPPLTATNCFFDSGVRDMSAIRA
jgi:hypothetical protein